PHTFRKGTTARGQLKIKLDVRGCEWKSCDGTSGEAKVLLKTTKGKRGKKPLKKRGDVRERERCERKKT
ncbi:MAG: hypothetical protein ACXQT1_00070, partial [Methermicoccaceae archaeon]